MQKENFLSEKVFAFESPSAVVSGVLSASPKVPSWYTQNAYVEKVEVDNVATTKEKQNRCHARSHKRRTEYVLITEKIS